MPLPGHPDRNRASPPARPARRSQPPPRKSQEQPSGGRAETRNRHRGGSTPRPPHPPPRTPLPCIQPAAQQHYGGGGPPGRRAVLRVRSVSMDTIHHPPLARPPWATPRPGPARPPLAAELRAQLPRRLRGGRRPRPPGALGAGGPRRTRSRPRHTPVPFGGRGRVRPSSGGRGLRPVCELAVLRRRAVPKPEQRRSRKWEGLILSQNKEKNS